MKKILITVAVFAMFGAFVTSCQKESSPATSIEYVCSGQMVVYRIDNHEYRCAVPEGDAWYDFLSRMTAIAREGHRVSIRLVNLSSQAAATKEKVTFETRDPEEAAAWWAAMLEAGYEVTVFFDEETGVYTLIAIKE